MSNPSPKSRTITLTGRAPVRIVEADWPVIAKASDWSGGSGHECQANQEASVRVRQHSDGRAIVYGLRDSGPGGMPLGYRGVAAGEVVDAGGDIAAAITRVVESLGPDWSGLAEDCIANLPAQEI